MLTRDAILEFLKQERNTLHQMGVQRIGLFGSYGRGQNRADSDIDLLFSMTDFTFGRWMDVWNYLEDSLDHTVDLVPEKDLRDEIRETVLAEVEYVEVA